MNDADERPQPPAPTPFEAAARPPASARSEATKVEQSRAVAEVQAAVLIAKGHPRNQDAAAAELDRACKHAALADRAFFRFNRGDGVVTGASIHLAREMARCWGNIDFGVKELERDDAAGRSEMLAFAWDMQTNARVEVTFIVPHKRDVRGGQRQLNQLRDIYENNANAAARRLRECIFAVLPVWFIETGKDKCRETIAGEVTQEGLADNIKTCVDVFARIGVTADQLAAKMGRSPDKFDAEDLATLRVIYRSIRERETTKDEEFPPAAPAIGPGATAFERAAAGTTSAEGERTAAAEASPATFEEPAAWSDGPTSPLRGGSWPEWTGWGLACMAVTPPAHRQAFLAKFPKEFSQMKATRNTDWERVTMLVGADAAKAVK